MSALTKAQLLAALAVQTQTVTVNGIDVNIKTLSVAEIDDVRERLSGDKGSNFGLGMTAYAVVDEAGQPMFNIEDLTEMRALSSKPMGELIKAVLRVNGYKDGSEKVDSGNGSGETKNA